MSGLVMPKPDAETMRRRDEIVTALRAIVPGEGVVDAINEMRAFESDGLTAYQQLPLVVVLPETVAQVSRVLKYCNEHKHPRRAARFGHLAVGRRAAAGRCRAAGHEPLQPHPRDRFSQPRRRRPAGRHQSRHHHRRRAGGLLLRPRSILPDRLLDRRQRRGKLRRRALPEIRADRQQCARHRDGADGWRGRAARRQASRFRRLRPARRHDRFGRPARRRHRGHRAHPEEARDGARAADRLSDQRAGRPVRRRHHRRRHHSGRHGDDGPAGDPCGRGFRPRRLSARMRGAADRRTRRPRRRGRPSDRPGRGHRPQERLHHLPDIDSRKPSG